MRRIVVCLDGTWNNPYQRKERDDGTNVVKPSNPLKLCRAVYPVDPEHQVDQITYYDSGVGALGKYPGTANKILGATDGIMGGAWGAGFEANIEQAVTFLVHNYRPGDEVFLFGFSRGAAQARGLTRFLDWMGGLPTKRDAYFIPLYFREYVASGGLLDTEKLNTSIGTGLQDSLMPCEIKMLGVWDTVMALGSRFRAKSETSVDERSFHVGDKPAQCVRNARQALAVDEKRYDFRPEIWRGSGENQTLEQRWFPGVHSNVGGGYVKDGLANIAFRWLIDEAKKLGLAIDHEVVKFYRPYPQHTLYESRSASYRFLEAVRFRRGRGVRSLINYPEKANFTLDKSVIHRISADPAEHEQLDERYKPENVFEWLALQEDLPAYLTSLGLRTEQLELPSYVMERIQKLKK